MSLSVALRTAQTGLSQVEKQIAIVSSNINNSDRAGYTRKTLKSTYASTGLVTTPITGVSVQAVPDALLAKQIVVQSTDNASKATLSSYLSDYSQSMGSLSDSSATLSSAFNDLTSSLQILEANPSDSSAKSKVVSVAQSLTSQLNSLSQTVQNERLKASNDISYSVSKINESLQTISDLNQHIASANATGEGAADLEDQRTTALQSLSEQLGIQYFTDQNGEVQVYTTTGSPLVTAVGYSTVAYSAPGTMSASTTYPGGISGVTLNGTDITSSLTAGKIGALIQLRDTTFPDEQSKLDNFSNSMQTTVNTVLNQGTAYPPLNTVTGTVSVSSGTALSATGTFRVAVTNQTGIVQNYTDLNLSSYATVGALVTALNGISGVSASINSSGYLTISATSSTNGISTNPMTSSISGSSITQYFGLNNLFVTNGTATAGATNIGVNSALISNYSGLATGALSSSATLAASSRGVSSGDASVTTALINAIDAAQSFSAAGNFGARTSSLSSYAGAIISDAATQASAAKTSADTASATYTYLSNNYTNETGVNINEETANLSSLQTSYQANAQVISTVKALFDALLSAVR